MKSASKCPPVNLEFGDFLRAIITADCDLVRDDDRGYRVAFIDAFRERGIVPYDIRRLAEDSLLWEPPPMDAELSDRFSDVLPLLDLTWGLTIERQSAFKLSQKNGAILQRWLAEPTDPKRRLLRQILGFEEPAGRWTGKIGDQSFTGEIRPIETHSVRVCRRSAPDGSSKSTLVIELTQTFRAEPNQDRYRGGCTLLFDLNDNRLKYLVRKRLFSPWSMKNQAAVRYRKRHFLHGEVREIAAGLLRVLIQCGRREIPLAFSGRLRDRKKAGACEQRHNDLHLNVGLRSIRLM